MHVGNGEPAPSGIDMHEHVFVDESKTGGFMLAAVSVRPADLGGLRSLVGNLRLKGQRRVHFTSESDARRKQILQALKDAGVNGRIYDARQITSDKEARDTVIARLADDVAAMGARRLVLELDDSVARNDRRIIFERMQKVGQNSLEYCHMRAREECLLSLPDALAWSYGRGGHWRKLAKELVTEVVEL